MHLLVLLAWEAPTQHARTASRNSRGIQMQ